MAKKNEVIATFGAEDKSGNAITSAKARLKELKAEMTALALAGKQNTDQFRALADEAGELNDTMGDVIQTIRNVGSDTQNIEVFSEAVKGVAAGFAIAQGAAALFGEENEELQKVLVQVQGSMALLNGVTEITNLLQAESQIMIKANAIALGIYNGILRITGTTAATATISLRAFKIALATTGIGALVVGIAYFVEAMNKASKATKDATKARENFESTKSNQETRLKQFDNETTIIVNNLRIRNEAELKIAKTIQERIRLRNVETKQIIATNIDEINRLRESVKAEQKAINDKQEAKKKAEEWDKTHIKPRVGRGGGVVGQRNPYIDDASANVTDAQKKLTEVNKEIIKLQNENIELTQQMTILTQEGQLGVNTALTNAGKKTQKTAEDNLNDVKAFIEEAKRIVRDANEEEHQKELNAIEDRYTEIGKKVVAGSAQEAELRTLKEQELTATRQRHLKENNDKYLELVKQQNLALRKEGKTAEQQSIIDLENEFEELFKIFKEGSTERIALEKLLQDRITQIQKEGANERNKTIEDKLKESNQRINAITLDDFQKKKEDTKAFYKDLLEQAKGNADLQAKITKALNDELTALDKKQAEDTKKARLQNTLDLVETGVTSTFGAINDIITATAGKSEAAQRKAFEQSKKFALAETLISTYVSAQKAYESQLSTKTPDAPIRGGIAAAFAIIAGLGKYVKIQNSQFDSPSAPKDESTGSVSGGITGMLPPQFGGGSTSPNGLLGNLTNPNGNNGQNTNDNQSGMQPIRAYVVERDITQTNTRIQRLQEFATLGN